MSALQVQHVLATHPETELAYVFGSVALERARPESDVDVAVQAGKPLGTTLRMQLIEELALATGRPVDLIDLRTIGEPLLGQILKYGKRIVGSPAAHAGLISRHVYAMEDFVPYVTRMLEERRRAYRSFWA